jgi:hypothetical protein
MPSLPKIQPFTFYIEGEIFARFIEEFRCNFTSFSESRKWTIEQPTLFLNDYPGEESFLIGGELKIFDAWSGNLSKHDDMRNYYDVESVIDFLVDYSFRYSAEIEFELGDKYVGSIASGRLDESLAIGLLSEWRKGLGL